MSGERATSGPSAANAKKAVAAGTPTSPPGATTGR